MKKTTILVIVLLVAGVGCCAAAFGMGLNEISVGDFSFTPRFLKYQEEAVDKGLAVSTKIGRLEMDIDNAECVIRTGDAYQLTAGSGVTWKQEGTTLTIEQEQPGGWWWRSKPAPITLTVPEDTALSYLDVDVDAGTVSVSDLEASHGVACNVDAGYIELDHVDTGSMEMDVDAGAISYVGILRGPAQLECDAGSIDLTLRQGSTAGSVNGSVDAGSVSVYVNGQEVLQNDGFSETVSADLPGAIGNDRIALDCDVGSISVTLTTKQAQ
ncbi:MAG: DUF4097 family beta strand repeat-containing protein [Eubacteriales bacterium]|nr:DUF4097 family beta strand repeat-containing protein [Eubacteriales bacterium]